MDFRGPACIQGRGECRVIRGRCLGVEDVLAATLSPYPTPAPVPLIPYWGCGCEEDSDCSDPFPDDDSVSPFVLHQDGQRMNARDKAVVSFQVNM